MRKTNHQLLGMIGIMLFQIHVWGRTTEEQSITEIIGQMGKVDNALNSNLCLKGGFQYFRNHIDHSKELEVISTFKRAYDENPCKDLPKSHPNLGLDLKNAEDRFISETKKFIANTKCDQFKKYLEKWLQDYPEKKTKHLETTKESLDEMISLYRDQEPEKQVHYNNYAAAGMACTTGILTRLALEVIRLNLEIDLMKEYVPIDPNCDVSVQPGGHEGPQEHKFALTNDHIMLANLYYDSYTVPDQFSIFLKDREIYKTSCEGTQGEKKAFIDISKMTAGDVLTIKITSGCDGTQGSGWRLRLACDKDPPEPKPYCQQERDEYSKELFKYLKAFYPTMKALWNRSICYQNYHDKVLSYFEVKTFPWFDQDSRPLNCDNPFESKGCYGQIGNLQSINEDEIDSKNKASNLRVEYSDWGDISKLKHGEYPDNFKGHTALKCHHLIPQTKIYAQRASRAFCNYLYENVKWKATPHKN